MVLLSTYTFAEREFEIALHLFLLSHNPIYIISSLTIYHKIFMRTINYFIHFFEVYITSIKNDTRLQKSAYLYTSI